MTDTQMAALIAARSAGGQVTESDPSRLVITMPDGAIIVIRLDRR